MPGLSSKRCTPSLTSAFNKREGSACDQPVADVYVTRYSATKHLESIVLAPKPGKHDPVSEIRDGRVEPEPLGSLDGFVSQLRERRLSEASKATRSQPAPDQRASTVQENANRTRVRVEPSVRWHWRKDAGGAAQPAPERPQATLLRSASASPSRARCRGPCVPATRPQGQPATGPA